MRLRILTRSTVSAPWRTPAAHSWWRRSTAMVKPGGAQLTHRLTKGQKANKKRMATVATVFTRAPWVRTPQQAIESLFPTNPRTPGIHRLLRVPKNKRVWASLLKGETAVILDVADEMDRRDLPRSLTRL